MIAFPLDSSNLVDFRLLEANFMEIGIVRKTLSRGVIGQGGCPLEVLWTSHLPSNLIINPSNFKNLVSLKVDVFYSQPEWRRILKHSSSGLRHLGISFYSHENEVIESLQFPKLEILESLEREVEDQTFPGWILVPESLNLGSFGFLRNLPSITELLVRTIEDCQLLSGRCPRLQRLKFRDWSWGFGIVTNLWT